MEIEEQRRHAVEAQAARLSAQLADCKKQMIALREQLHSAPAAESLENLQQTCQNWQTKAEEAKLANQKLQEV